MTLYLSFQRYQSFVYLFYRYIDAHQEKFIATLGAAVAIKSVSAWPETRSEITRMVKWVAEKIEQLGGPSELRDIGKQVFFSELLSMKQKIF